MENYCLSKKLINLISKKGFYGTFEYLFGKYILSVRRLIFLKKALNINLPEFSPQIDNLILKNFSNKDLATYVDFTDSWHDLQDVKERLGKGYQLFYLEAGNTIVAYIWAEYRNIQISDFYLNLDLEDSVVYVSCVFTKPDFRNKGVAKVLYSELFKELQRKNFRIAFIVIEPKNRISMKVAQDVGLELFQKVVYIKLLFSRIYLVGSSSIFKHSIIFNAKINKYLNNKLVTLTKDSGGYNNSN